AIGKIHAEILQEGEDFYIVDCNSRNGTFLNDNRIAPNTKNKVNNNDLLRFANKDFVFFYSSSFNEV
ncbi:MAG: FHA domain-containing protein, partial [Ruminiclostridium sp.]